MLENGYALFFKSSFRKVLGCAGYSRGSPCGVKVKVRESTIEENSWWSRGGSNSWPPHCERGALPTELLPHAHENTVSSFEFQVSG